MKRNGMTIIELVVAFALTSVIALFLVQVVVFLKDTYVVNAVRSEIVLKQSTVSNMINELLDDNSIKSIDQNCGDNCVLVTFDDSTTQEINFDVEGNRIIVGDYVSKLPSTSKIDNVDVRKQFFLDENGETSYVFSISADVTSELFNDEIFKISAVYQSVFADKEDDSTDIPDGGGTGDEPIETTYEITYDCNGGSGSTAKSIHIYGVASNLSTNGCYKITSGTGTGTSASPNVYYLVGWSTSSTATTATYADGQSVTDVAESGTVTLYAVWDKLFTYTKKYQVIDDNNGNWRVKFLESGTCKTNSSANIDIFLVGGGEGGGCGSIPGGGGGYTTTQKNYPLVTSKSYSIVIGAGGTGATTATLNTWSKSDGGNGGTSSAFGYTAAGGGSEKQGWGGNGGGGMHNNGVAGTGGAYGWPGENVDEDNQYSAAGDGQHTSTCEFAEGGAYSCNSGVDAYAGGGGGGAISTGSPGKGGEGGGGSYGGDGQANTGGGGGSTYYNGSTWVQPGDGGSGVVVIRNAR